MRTIFKSAPQPTFGPWPGVDRRRLVNEDIVDAEWEPLDNRVGDSTVADARRVPSVVPPARRRSALLDRYEIDGVEGLPLRSWLA